MSVRPCEQAIINVNAYRHRGEHYLSARDLIIWLHERADNNDNAVEAKALREAASVIRKQVSP